jgi:hypothetical protein
VLAKNLVTRARSLIRPKVLVASYIGCYTRQRKHTMTIPSLRNGMKNWTRIAVGLTTLFIIPPAKAQSVPGPSMSIPEASSKPGFDWGTSLGFNYLTSAKCSLLSAAVSCTSTGSSAFSISPAAMVQYDRLRLEVTVPFVDIEGPGTLSGALGTPEIVAQAGGPTERRSGLGDVSVGGAFILMREGPILPRLEIAGVVKLPTAVNGLGTGQTDYGVQLTFYRPLLAGVKTFGSIGYQRIGDPNTLQLHDGERATLGLDINYSNWGGGALLDYEKSLFPGVPNSFTVDPYVTLPFIARSRLQVYTTIALTHSSPNHEVGVRFVL